MDFKTSHSKGLRPASVPSIQRYADSSYKSERPSYCKKSVASTNFFRNSFPRPLIRNCWLVTVQQAGGGMLRYACIINIAWNRRSVNQIAATSAALVRAEANQLASDWSKAMQLAGMSSLGAYISVVPSIKLQQPRVWRWRLCMLQPEAQAIEQMMLLSSLFLIASSPKRAIKPVKNVLSALNWNTFENNKVKKTCSFVFLLFSFIILFYFAFRNDLRPRLDRPCHRLVE